MAIAVGTKAPDFSLKSKQASGVVDVKLSNNSARRTRCVVFSARLHRCLHQGNVRHHRRTVGVFRLNADVIGISVDSPFAQEAWAQKEKIGITWPAI